jgi:arylsulfatase A-like enzyme
LDEFAEVATFYPRAFATSPWTLPSHASLFTGVYPFEHGAHAFKIEEDQAREGALEGSHLTLAEVFKAEGYRTAAFVGNAVYLNQRFQLDQGFESYFNERTYARALNRLVLDWLRQHGSQPFFLFINYVDTHNPYNAGKRSDDPGFLEPDEDRQSYYLLEELRPHILKRERPFPHDKVRLLIDQYDTAIFNLDAEIGNLLVQLRKMALYEDTMIVLTSDHGEFLGEHELIDHGKDLYQPVLWVPLIIKNPGQREGKVDTSVVSGAHLPHLILLQLPRDVAERNLPSFPNAPGRQPALGENYFTMPYDFNRNPWERERFDRVRAALVEWPYKFIHDSRGRHELYELENDPGESKNLFRLRPEVVRRLSRQLEQSGVHSGAVGEPSDVRPPNREEIENLKALGYLGEDSNPAGNR